MCKVTELYVSVLTICYAVCIDVFRNVKDTSILLNIQISVVIYVSL